MEISRRITFVCERNVCRSPLMEATFVANTSASRWITSSRGTLAQDGASMCTVSRGVAESAGLTIGDHTSRRATADALRTQHLIITASRAERAALAKIDPRSRPRTFTMREVNHLAATPFSAEERALIGDVVTGLARVLHARRGLIEPPSASRGVFARLRTPTHPFDIVDVHGEPAGRHQSGLVSLMEETKRFAAVMTALTHKHTVPGADPS